MSEIKVLLADDHALIRKGIESTLDREPSLKLVGKAEDGHQAVDLANKHTPDVVILDLEMPKLSGAKAAIQILSQTPDTKVVALSAYCDLKSIIGMLNVGAKAYVSKRDSSSDLIKAINSVINDQVYFSPAAQNIVNQSYLETLLTEKVSHQPFLTKKEKQIFHLFANGLNIKEIAKELRLSVKTIANYQSSIKHKLGIPKVTDIAQYANRKI